MSLERLRVDEPLQFVDFDLLLDWRPCSPPELADLDESALLEGRPDAVDGPPTAFTADGDLGLRLPTPFELEDASNETSRLE